MYGVVFVVGDFVLDGVIVLYLFFEVIDDWGEVCFVGFVVEFFGIGIGYVGQIVCGFDYGYLYVQIDVQIGYFFFVGIFCGCDYVFGVVFVKVVGNDDVVIVVQQMCVLIFQFFVVDLIGFDVDVVGYVVMGQCFGN